MPSIPTPESEAFETAKGKIDIGSTNKTMAQWKIVAYTNNNDEKGYAENSIEYSDHEVESLETAEGEVDIKPEDEILVQMERDAPASANDVKTYAENLNEYSNDYVRCRQAYKDLENRREKFQEIEHYKCSGRESGDDDKKAESSVSSQNVTEIRKADADGDGKNS